MAFYFECSAVFEICIVLVYSVVIVSYLLCFLVFLILLIFVRQGIDNQKAHNVYYV